MSIFFNVVLASKPDGRLTDGRNHYADCIVAVVSVYVCVFVSAALPNGITF